MPAVVTSQDCVLWTQRVEKEAKVNAKVNPGGFSVRNAISSPGVPAKFKPLHFVPDRNEGVGGFDPRQVGIDPESSMVKELRHLLVERHSVPRDRHYWPETTGEDIGWLQAKVQATKEKEQRATVATLPKVGIGWMDKPTERPLALKGEKASKKPEPQHPPYAAVSAEARKNAASKLRKAQREEQRALRRLAKDTQHQCSATQDVATSQRSTAQGSLVTSKSQSRLASTMTSNEASKRSTKTSVFLPLLPSCIPTPGSDVNGNEAAISAALDKCKRFLNRPSNRWYKPRNTSDVAEFAAAYTMSWGVQLYKQNRKKD